MKEITMEGNVQKFSIPSAIAVIAAILSFATGAFLGFIFAVVAILSGVVGIVLALSPKVRGGIASSAAVVAGLLGIVAAVFKLIF